MDESTEEQEQSEIAPSAALDDNATLFDTSSPSVYIKPPAAEIADTRKANNLNWKYHILYSGDAGIVSLGSDVISQWRGESVMSQIRMQELYSSYEFESFTFMQEIIPNLFLGRYVSV